MIEYRPPPEIMTEKNDRVSACAPIGGAGAGDDRRGDNAALLVELTEALTATGNYLAAASQLLDAEPDPTAMDCAQPALRGVIEKTRVQFSRATDAVRGLRASLDRKTGTQE